MKDLYAENQKILLEEIKGDTNKWKDILCLLAGIIIIKMSI